MISKISQQNISLLNRKPVATLLVVLWFVFMAIVINAKPITEGILFEAPDVWPHLFWLDQFYRHMSEGILYPRWFGSGNYGMGSPAFVFYPPLVHFAGSSLRLLVHMNTEQEFILLQTAAVAFAGMSCYFYLKSKHDSFTAFAAASFYTVSPYLMYDCYMRGALPESFTFAELPLLLWCSEIVLCNPKRLWLLSLLWATLALTNMPILLLSLLIWPFSLAAFTLSAEKSGRPTLKNIASTLASIPISFALIAAYLLPAVLEKPLINAGAWLYPIAMLDTRYGGMGFAKCPELIPIFWFTIVTGLIIGLATLAYRKTVKEPIRPVAGWLALFALQVFLMTGLSQWLWKSGSILQYVQFPWRGLLYASLFNTMIFASLLSTTRKQTDSKRLMRILCIVVLAQLFLSSCLADFLLAKFRRGLYGTEPQMLGANVDPGIYAARAVTLPRILRTGPWLPDEPEYLPLIQKTNKPPAPTTAEPPVPLVFSDAQTVVQRWDNYDRKLIASTDKPCPLKIRTFAFPGWNCYLDNRKVLIQQDDIGQIQIDLPQGFHTLEFRFERTAWERLGIIVSAIAGGLLFMYVASLQFTKSKRT